MKEYKKYIIIFPLAGQSEQVIKHNMDIIALETNTEAYYKRMIPHITFYQPIENISIQKIENLLVSICNNSHKARVRITGIDHFDRDYIVATVQPSLSIAQLWVNINTVFSKFLSMEADKYNPEFVLHVTIARKFSDFFETYFQVVKKFCQIEPFDIIIDKVSIYGKENTTWELIKEIPLPDK